MNSKRVSKLSFRCPAVLPKAPLFPSAFGSPSGTPSLYPYHLFPKYFPKKALTETRAFRQYVWRPQGDLNPCYRRERPYLAFFPNFTGSSFKDLKAQ